MDLSWITIPIPRAQSEEEGVVIHDKSVQSCSWIYIISLQKQIIQLYVCAKIILLANGYDDNNH